MRYVVYKGTVRRTTIPDALEPDLEEYLADQGEASSLNAMTQTAAQQSLSGTASSRLLIGRVIENRSAIKRIARNHGTTAVFLFGSAARGEAHASSDLDLAVEVGDGITLFDLARLRAALVTLLDTDIDVVPLNGLADSFRAGIDAEAIEL